MTSDPLQSSASSPCPQFYDSKIVATGEGREVTRVQAGGLVRVQLQVVSRGLAAHGYATGGPPDALDLGDAAAAEGALERRDTCVKLTLLPST